ncbi:MAG: YdcF family protein [Oscillospiraceae bacterium]|nr:YdcF family protein [Oscillospiraceae bacterium]
MTKRRKYAYIALGAFAALCALVAVLYRPLRVCGVLGVCAAAVAVVFDLLCRKQEKRWARNAVKLIALLLASGIAILTMLEIRIVDYGKTDPTKDVSAVVILGAGLNGTKPSLSLRVRLEQALVYLDGRGEVPIIVSGGQGGGEDITEARCMADWLIDHGIDEARIILEENSHNTEENIRYTRAVLKDLGISSAAHVAVITSDYHLYRTRLHWGNDWMVPVAAKMPASFWPLTLNYYLREAFAVAELAVFGG